MDAGMTCHQVARQPGIYVEAKYVVCLRRLIAVLERRVYVHALETLELLGTLETAANPKVLGPDGRCSGRHPEGHLSVVSVPNPNLTQMPGRGSAR